MIKVRNASINDTRVLDGIYEFILSLELDILKEVSKEKFYEIITDCFLSTVDRFNHTFCKIAESDGEIAGFSFSYEYSAVEKAKTFWFNNIVTKYELKENSIIFDYDEVLAGELNIDTLYVFEKFRGKGVGTALLKEFCTRKHPAKSINVAESNHGARKLYESFGFIKECQIWIGHENYDHMLIRE